MTHVEIQLSPDPANERVLLNGEDISRNVSAVEVEARAGGNNRIRLQLSAASEITVTGQTKVYLTLSTVNLLRRAGWTPPEDSRGGTEPITLAPADEKTEPTQ